MALGLSRLNGLSKATAAAIVPITSVSHPTPATTSSSNIIVISSAAAVNDVVILIDRSTTTTQVVPTGFTLIDSASTTGIRTTVSYKQLVAGDPNSTLTGQAGSTSKILYYIRGNTKINTITPAVVGTQATTAVPTSQYPNLPAYAAPNITLAVYSATGAIGTRTFTPNAGAERSSSTALYGRLLISNVVNGNQQTISMSDGGTNTLQSFVITFT